MAQSDEFFDAKVQVLSEEIEHHVEEEEKRGCSPQGAQGAISTWTRSASNSRARKQELIEAVQGRRRCREPEAQDDGRSVDLSGVCKLRVSAAQRRDLRVTTVDIVDEAELAVVHLRREIGDVDRHGRRQQHVLLRIAPTPTAGRGPSASGRAARRPRAGCSRG